MSTLALAETQVTTLADVLGQSLDEALGAGSGRCVWCGASAVVAVADRWTGRVVLRCPDCGSELEGIGRRHTHEGRA